MTRSHLNVVSAEEAYRVPWVFERDDPNGHYALRNTGRETLAGVSLALYGAGLLPVSAPATLAPGDVLELTIAGRDLARDTIGVIRWFRPSGQEYLWRVSF